MWVLLIYIYVGAFASSDLVSIVRIPGFTSEKTCTSAAKNTTGLIDAGPKEYYPVCAPQ